MPKKAVGKLSHQKQRKFLSNGSYFLWEVRGKVITKSDVGDTRLEESEKTLNRYSGEWGRGRKRRNRRKEGKK